jgi:hypothetical protein
MGQTEPQFLSDPMSDRRKKVFANSVIPNVWYNSYLRFCPKGIDQCLILFLNYIIFIVFTPFIHFRFQPNPIVKTRAPDRLRICVFYAMKNACIIRSECTFTHAYCCVSKLSKFEAYLYAVDDNTSCT